jgi:hypothetical protein
MNLSAGDYIQMISTRHAVHAHSPELARFSEWDTPVVRYP